MLSLLLHIFTMSLPQSLKIFMYKKYFKFDIGENCYIGLSLLFVEKAHLENNTYIGNFNVFKNISLLRMGTGSRITTRNIFTSQFFLKSKFQLGSFSSISMDHYFDVTDNINIGSNCIIAGRHSTFFTHTLRPDLLSSQASQSPIKIGDWCYIGSNTKVTPKVNVPDHCFVGMGSVLVQKNWSSYSLIAGNPAIEKRALSKDSLYFSPEYLSHRHHIGDLAKSEE